MYHKTQNIFAEMFCALQFKLI